MDAGVHAKITLRHLGDKAEVVAEPITGDDIRKLREDAHLSQAVFAGYLNLTPGYVSQYHLARRRITFVLRRALGDLFLGPYSA